MNAEQEIKMIKTEWFKNHQAVFTEEGKLPLLTWAQPGTSNYWCRYIIDGRALIVYGDIGNAIYGWSDRLTWEFLAGLDLDYFAGKCMASENGRGYKTWDPDAARRRLSEFLASHPAFKRKFMASHGMGCLSHAGEWQSFLATDGYNVFGEEYIELGEIGRAISNRCRAHLIGIKMAMAATLKPA